MIMMAVVMGAVVIMMMMTVKSLKECKNEWKSMPTFLKAAIKL